MTAPYTIRINKVMNYRFSWITVAFAGAHTAFRFQDFFSNITFQSVLSYLVAIGAIILSYINIRIRIEELKIKRRENRKHSKKND